MAPMRSTPRLALSRYLLSRTSADSWARCSREVLSVLSGLLISWRSVRGIFFKKVVCWSRRCNMAETLRARSPTSSPALAPLSSAVARRRP